MVKSVHKSDWGCLVGEWYEKGAGPGQPLPGCAPVCQPPCQNRGVCVRPGYCHCQEWAAIYSNVRAFISCLSYFLYLNKVACVVTDFKTLLAFYSDAGEKLVY